MSDDRTPSAASAFEQEVREADAEHDALVTIADAGRTAKLSIVFARAVKARLDLNREIAELEAKILAD